MPVTVEQLQDECARQDIVIARPLKRSLDYCRNDGSLVKAMEFAGGDLRKSREPLVSKPIEGDVWAGDSAATALRRLIDSTVEPVPDDPETLSFACRGAKTIGACSYAEEAFARTIRSIETGKGRGEMDFGCDIFTSDGVPVFIRKSQGEPSSLSLSEVVINGTPYPQGSIMRIDTHREVGRYPRPEEYAIRQLDVAEIAKIAFVRLSAWALSPEERTEKAINTFTYSQFFPKHLWNTVAMTSIDEIQAVAQEAVDPIISEAAKPAPKGFTNHFVILSQLAQ